MSGTVADPATKATDGEISVSRLDDAFPPINWPVTASHFKALVYLNPGPNKLRFDFAMPKLVNSGSSNPIHSTTITIHMMPMSSSPPLQLCILVAKDSPGTFDSTPARISTEGNGLETAIRKFRMCAYLWQAYTAEQMFRNKMGRRCFRFEEEWQTGTSSFRDRDQNTMRNEAKIHVIRTNRTVAELRDPNIAQQNPHATDKNGLFHIAGEALNEYFKPKPGQEIYASVLILDTHWDASAKLLTGHAALGGSSVNGIKMGIFGSHALHSYPSAFEEVVPAFTDCTKTDTTYCANDCNESASSWEACNIGIGAHLHETGHLLGCPHQENGIMLRDYVTLNRTFITKESFCCRANTKGGLVLEDDECTWHRLDLLRFRSHPCFRLPNDAKLPADKSVQAWPVDNSNVLVTAASGVAFIELFPGGDGTCHWWVEYGDGNGRGPVQRQVVLKDAELKSMLPESERGKKLKLVVHSYGGGTHEIPDFGLLTSKASTLKLANGQTAFRGAKLGLSRTKGSQSEEVIFTSALNLVSNKVDLGLFDTSKQSKVMMTKVVIYHGLFLDGMEFIYEAGQPQLFGKRGGKKGGSEFRLGKHGSN